MSQVPISEPMLMDVVPVHPQREAFKLQRQLTTQLRDVATHIRGLKSPSLIHDDLDHEDEQRRGNEICDMSNFLHEASEKIQTSFLDRDGQLEGSIYDPCTFHSSGVYNLMAGLSDVLEAASDVLDAKASRSAMRTEE